VLATTFGVVLLLSLSSAAADLPKPGLAETNGALSVGSPAPPLVGTDIAGRAITPETFKGRPVLVDFGSLFCTSCQETLKDFARLQKAYKATDLALIVVTDGAASPKTMGEVFGKLGATYTVIRDEGAKLFGVYGVKLIPFQVVIDRQGVVRKIHNGFDSDLETVLGLKELAGLGSAVAK
jgi:peroxiredoxin